MDLLISVSSLSHSRCIEDEPFVKILETNLNYTLHYLQNILPYTIIKCKLHYVS